ncbi:putative ATP-grasp-modified RiPP [Streptomyces sp. SID11385]|uniref:putative ATP-grasp-modified RiPP n=1 Tax=Streptomyces sp. SID11385 TaxID=2706031 RepID=UPI0013C886DE|nr:putative ATP-grasp-modified RiPP [Streptomyces sp. SID11385]NEA41460.1 putative ATP-grasp-modified RiPP [Streptomyces sp. SID11385]
MTNYVVPPWGTTRLRPFPSVTVVPAVSTEIDPDTQLGIRRDRFGRVVEMGKHGTGTAVETSTITSPDGQNGNDQGHDQNTDQDEGGS